jgi:antitoxin ParD1/3/4
LSIGVYWQRLPKSLFLAVNSWRCAAPTRHVDLTAAQEAFVEETVKASKYQNASEAVRDHRQDELRLKALRMRVAAAVAALACGAFTEVEEAMQRAEA